MNKIMSRSVVSKSIKFILKSHIKIFIFPLLLLFVLLLGHSCYSPKSNMEQIIASDSIQYWDMYIVENNKIKEYYMDLGFAFTNSMTVLNIDYYEQKKYRLLSSDCDNADRKGCTRWKVSDDSIFNTYVVGGVNMIQLKIIKCSPDTIFGKKLNGEGELLFVRVKDLNSIVRQGNPLYEKLLKSHSKYNIIDI